MVEKQPTAAKARSDISGALENGRHLQAEDGVNLTSASPDPVAPSPPLLYGPVPRFTAPSPRNPRFRFDSLGGRAIAMTFFGSAASEKTRALIAGLQKAADVEPSDDRIFIGVSSDRRDQTERDLQEKPRFILFWDFETRLAEAFGVAQRTEDGSRWAYVPRTLVIDPRLRLFRSIPISEPDTHVRQVVEALQACALSPTNGRQNQWAPVLDLPRVFEPQLCRALIEHYESKGGRPSGFMRQQGGKTVGILDPSFKRRSDAPITDRGLMKAARDRIAARLLPEIARAFQFRTSRIERDIVACYDANDGGFFNAHRDNTTTGTTHRRFAVTVNLNSDEFEGGELCFPEFGNASYKATTGGAVVFSCSLLHKAQPVTSGTRYCYLPFLYDDAAAKIRNANLSTLDGQQRDAEGRVIGST